MRESTRVDGFVQAQDWLDPSEAMLADPRFEAIWQTIKTWDINVPGAYAGYEGATGNHVRAILDALDRAIPPAQEGERPCGD